MSKKKQNEQLASTNTEQPERSGILFTEGEGHSLKLNTQKQESKAIDGTPFAMVREMQEDGVKHLYFAGLGRFKLTPKFETEEEVIKYMETEKWNLIFSLMGIIIPQEVTAQIAYRDEQTGLKIERLQMEREGRISVTREDLKEQ